jgi:hypothetical protein
VATTSRRTPRETGAGVGSDRAHGHLRVVAGDGDLLERSTRRGDSPSGIVTARRSGSPGTFGWSVGNGAVVEEPKELGPPQLDSARLVPGTRTEGSGNRVSVKRCHGFEAGKPVSSPNAASPATPNGETGDVNRSKRRLTPDHRPVVDLSTRAAPEGAQARARSADRGAFVFDPSQSGHGRRLHDIAT